MKHFQTCLIISAALLVTPFQCMAGQTAEESTLNLKEITRTSQVIQKKMENLAHPARISIRGEKIPFSVPMQQFNCRIADNACVCSMFFNARYQETDEYRNVLIQFYPARITKVVYEPDSARLAFSGTAGFMERASEDSMLVESKELEKKLKSQDETMSGYISFSTPQSALQSSNAVTEAMKDLVSLCGGILAAR